ncbi:Potassium/sodium hyperpolarization-activated cyclic nucleotide-gated channel [Operophtera brumata]|uniref:Potassium/sodium hyperpolarization-activated cyclic nucleotide-gated channel n=1 Tax=Operophtera brumata TaxID=104452 RepID=A0A0L7LJK8_OPEBR|nr:Potassium/sodium hyperpolarization-activated cyclic nucleotide-gated channel [Operophtera brumata]
MCLESRTRDFHESYYEHSCSVVAERDVLETDIRGTSFSARSSWDFFMLLVFILNKVTFHHNTSFIFSDLYRSFYYIGAGLELIIISDLFVNLATGYINQQEKKVVLDKRLGVLHYCSTKLFLHMASAMPLQWMIFLRYGSNFDCSLCKTSRFICALEIFSVLNLVRLYECSKYLSREWSSYKISYTMKSLRVFILGLLTMFQFIEMADIVTLRVMVEEGQIVSNSYVAILLRNRYGNEERSNAFLFFIIDFSRICKSILLFSFAYQNMTYYLDRIISLIAYMIASMFYLWIITEVFALICLLKYPEDRMILIKRSMVNMVRCRQLSDKVSAKLDAYYDFNFSKLKAVEGGNEMFESMPTVLRRELFMSCNSRFIMRIPYFAEWPIAIKSTISEGLCIVAAGALAVYSEDNEVGHLIDGDYFGELSLVTDGEHNTVPTIGWRLRQSNTAEYRYSIKFKRSPLLDQDFYYKSQL